MLPVLLVCLSMVTYHETRMPRQIRGAQQTNNGLWCSCCIKLDGIGSSEKLSCSRALSCTPTTTTLGFWLIMGRSTCSILIILCCRWMQLDCCLDVPHGSLFTRCSSISGTVTSNTNIGWRFILLVGPAHEESTDTGSELKQPWTRQGWGHSIQIVAMKKMQTRMKTSARCNPMRFTSGPVSLFVLPWLASSLETSGK